MSNPGTGSPEDCGSCENTGVHVLLLTDSAETGGVLRAMVHALGADFAARRVTNMGEVIGAARQEKWDVLIAHWRPGKAQKPAAGELANRLGGRIRRIEIETERGNLTLAALRVRQAEVSQHCGWLVFMAYRVLRGSRKKPVARLRGSAFYGPRYAAFHILPRRERE